MWDKVYSIDDYVYGTEPNNFFKEQIDSLPPGKLLLPAEGEGRNAVYAAKLGWEVTAFDDSTVANKKALELAVKNNVRINYIISSFEKFSSTDKFDLIALIYAHTSQRQQNNFKMSNFLSNNGKIILEGFSKSQLGKNTGGPKNIDMLFSKDELFGDFSYLNKIKFTELDIELAEGNMHKGNASIIRMVGTL